MRLAFTTLASGAAVSPTVDFTRGQLLAISVPGIVSGDLIIQGSPVSVLSGDTLPASGSFQRLMDPRFGSGDLRFATGPGSKMVPFPANINQPPYGRFEFSVAMTAPATLSLLFSR